MTSRDGTLIHVETLGDDGEGPTFVLAPRSPRRSCCGARSRGRSCDAVFRVVVYDLRGQGASGLAPAGDYTLARYGEDLEAVLAAAADGRGQEPILAGHSLGGMSIVAWAVEHRPRSRVRAAALINTAVAGVISESGVGMRGVPAALKHWLGVHVVSRRTVATATGVDRPEQGTAAQLGFWAARDRRTGGLAGADAVVVPNRGADGRGSLDRWDGSELGGAGDERPDDGDRGRARSAAAAHALRRIAAALPELVDLVVLPEVGHMSPLEASDLLVDELVRLASVPTDPAPNPASGQPNQHA